MLRFAPAITLLIMLGPLAAGLVGTLAPAFGYLPVLGGDTLSLGPWRQLFATPGLGRSVLLSATTGIGATVIAFASVMAVCAASQGTRAFGVLRRLLAPLLSVPHAATAFALAFLVAPSGWIMRLMSPWATGHERPPDLLVIHDLNGLALMVGLAIKEIPFLLLMTLAALNQIDAERRMVVARTLGYGRMNGWLKTVFPGLYPQLRLPVFAVLAYSLSVVDMAMILGPTNPPTLAVTLVRWTHDPDLALRFPAAAAAVLQLLLVTGAIGLWMGCERSLRLPARRITELGRRGRCADRVRWLALLPAVACAVVILGGLAMLVVWSLTRSWRFPRALPTRWTLDTWAAHLDNVAALVTTSAMVALVAAVIASVLAVANLENETSTGAVPGGRAMFLIYLPLIVPQVSFLFGLQMLLVAGRLDGTLVAVVWAHLVFVIPYVFLALADAYRAFDPRYTRTALCLNASHRRALWRVKLPILLRPIMTAAAVGFAISVGQYLPTLFAGAGRVATITTEAVALSASYDRRVVGVYALLQALLPFLGFAVAIGLPAFLYRSRRRMQVY